MSVWSLQLYLFILMYIKPYTKKRFNNSVQIKYEISQDIPLIQKPFFDGEYATNARLQTYAQMEKMPQNLL